MPVRVQVPPSAPSTQIVPESGRLAGSMKFVLDRLIEYSNEEIIKEVRRVADLVISPSLTWSELKDHGFKVGNTTIRRRFGGLKEVLEQAGLGHRYSGQPVTKKMREQRSRQMADDQIIEEMHRIRIENKKETLTVSDIKNSDRISVESIRSRFGSWENALLKAGIQKSTGRRSTEEECFENLLSVWTYYGRPPQYKEMSKPPSKISGKSYLTRFGGWNKALYAFVEKVNSPDDNELPMQNTSQKLQGEIGKIQKKEEDERSIRLSLRFKILSRDRFKCVLCGRSPSTDMECKLHVDHIIPFSKGGKTTEDNLRTLCSECNIGRGNRHYIDTSVARR